MGQNVLLTCLSIDPSILLSEFLTIMREAMLVCDDADA